MTRTWRLLSVVVCGVLFAAAPLYAHHNGNAKYDSSKPITLKGKVTKVEWMNPHTHQSSSATASSRDFTLCVVPMAFRISTAARRLNSFSDFSAGNRYLAVSG